MRLCSLSVRFVACLVSAASTLSGAQTPIFPTPTTLNSVNGPGGKQITDLDGDGKPDLVYLGVLGGSPAEDSVTTVLDFEGSSPATHNVALSCTAAGEPAIADVNKDGKPDVIVHCTNYVVVLLGNGDGTLQNPVYYASNGSMSPILVDLNGDGYPDIVEGATTNSGFELSVMLNKGSSSPGTFASAVNYSPGSGNNQFFALASGDFNGDGKQDIAGVVLSTGAASQTTPGVIVFSGKGDGTLSAGPFQPAGGANQNNAANLIATGDFNSDGITDVAFITYANAIDQGYTNIQVLLGSSSGTFTQGTSLPVSVPSQAIPSLIAADSGGSVDLIFSSSDTTIYHGDGKGGFSPIAAYSEAGDAYGQPLIWEPGSGGAPTLFLDGPVVNSFSVLSGNSDGSFQGLPATTLNQASNVVWADFNNDKIADMAYVSQPGASQMVLTTAVGRGNGTFGVLDQAPATTGNLLIAGDFNLDGNADVVAIGSTSGNAQLVFYAGNGNGTFQAAGTGTDLGVSGATAAVTGDFNGDGKPDVVVSYQNTGSGQAGLLFVQGNGDGTFKAPVSIASTTIGATILPLFAADLNNDGKLDLIWQAESAIFLGNGDGTFKQSPLVGGAPSQNLLALADMNGDNIPDLVTVGTAGAAVYAGNGDGTFQTTALYTIPGSAGAIAGVVGDVNSDGKPDLLVLESGVVSTEGVVKVAYGDGTGGFTLDPNAYFAGFSGGISIPQMMLARLNSGAPAGSADKALDLLVLGPGSNSVASLLNQENPAPGAVGPLNPSVSLQSSSTSPFENASVTLTASIAGINPTGTVTFSANGNSLGTGTVNGGVATLSTSFAAAGTYSVMASYAGDQNNAAASSSALSITVPAPDFSVNSSASSATVTPGTTATFTLNITPSGGYSGTVKFSCGTLPSEASCAFSPSSVTPSNGAAASTTLTISTTAAVSSLAHPENRRRPWLPTGTVALAVLLGLGIRPRGVRRFRQSLLSVVLLMLGASAFLALTGCGSSSSTQSNPGTPAGTYQVTVSLADSAGGPSHSLTLNVTVQ